jgi:aspartate/glutamate racemase
VNRSPPRIALIHALSGSVAPINDELARAWPDCIRMNLLDDSLSADLARNGALDERMTARFLALAGYAFDTGADAILFTCSAFGVCIDAVKQRWPDSIVLKPNEAMIDDAARLGRRIALVATFGPTLASMPAEFPSSVTVMPILAEGALEALQRGDATRHDTIVANAAQSAIEQGAEVIALAQFTMARAAPAVERAVAVPVLTTVASAVRALRAKLR